MAYRPDAMPSPSAAPAETSLGDLFSAMTSEMGTLVRQEVQLAKVETKEEVTRAGKAAGMLAGAGVAGLYVLLFVSLTLAWLLDQVMNRALAFAIVTLVWAVIAGALGVAGRARLKRVNALPQTVQSVKEDVQWAKAQRS